MQHSKQDDFSIWAERQSGPKVNRDNDYRTVYQRDRARIIHSAAFRRLQSKTQILAIRQNDYSRTRLTHSLEVSQIGGGIAFHLRHRYSDNTSFLPWLADDALIETICLSHDIGHPPFGHGGEVALNYMMTEHGGFEGNAQSLRILAKRGSYSEEFGMDVSRRSMLGVLKYPVLHDQVVGTYPDKPNNLRQFQAKQWSPPKCIYTEEADLLDWILSPFSTTDKERLTRTTSTTGKNHASSLYSNFDTSIMDLADDIAYGVHDLEDAIVLGMVTRDMWCEHLEPKLAKLDTPYLNTHLKTVREQLFSGKSHLRKEAIGNLVSWFITSCEITENTHFEHPLLRYNAALPKAEKEALATLKNFEMQHIIKRPEVQMLVYKGQQMLLEIFETLNADPNRLLPREIAAEWRAAEEAGHNSQRIICDYMSSMTDDYASRMYNTFFVPSVGSVFEPI
ncbi:anti-phage deoxyguanosine triphosphatase [Marinomonas mediterranea]|jgi:deoxyguanosinetriphosphate triphosphohydrolase, putative|uniref:Deoxyguanosinetriphosphate triphosphohydrolase-like protein n=1 Tax=Marinomonas mediterranea (strain ATCC 700492 / JCM 21426 / NBRC 103028 / MMB-1) TaxID=717774 RepID=F2K2C1_MARM1|nr:anti-phage deoxyguanosine triphosphatase [Marinomonas mediterranea]ADZ92301.1 Deoxyguanosinetriphosphate triphosphohydrolase-like protein [Marinomonas mediterranea MMB-1]WCN18352.1 dNTP triphosphohydrolase [Marinomonas mediterranea MMB-1]